MKPIKSSRRRYECEQLKKNKLAALATERPAVIATANIGCQAHLASGTSRPVRHWIEEIDTLLAAGA